MNATVQIHPEKLTIRNECIFRAGHESSARLFAQRVLAFPEVPRVSILPDTGEAWITYETAPNERRAFLSRLADAVIATQADPHLPEIPHWPAGAAVTLTKTANGIMAKSSVADPAEVPMAVSNASVGLSTLGILVPVATPLAAGMLVATNLNILRNAGGQLSRGKVGVPVFHTALLACSIATGQVLAFALTDWSLRYWQRRWRKTLSRESHKLSEEALSRSSETTLITAEGAEILRPVATLQPGDRIRIQAGEMVPADGRVALGDGLVDERMIKGIPHPVRKTVNTPIQAGALLLAGCIEVVVERVGQHTGAARMSDALLNTAAMIARDADLHRQAERMADRTVLPSLAVAGVGYMAGSLITVGAILHQDWISGPVLAVPLQTLNHMRQALRQGILICNSSALQRLSECDFIVIDGDDPRLMQTGLQLDHIESRLPDSNTLLRHIAGAGLYLGDARSMALVEAARQRGLVVRQPELLGLYANRVETRLDGHTLVLIDESPQSEILPPALRIVIDGHDAGSATFSPDHKPACLDAISNIRASGRQVFLMSSASESKTAELAHGLGIEQYGSTLDQEGKIRFLSGLMKRGVRTLYCGPVTARSDLHQLTHVTVATNELMDSLPLCDAFLPGGNYANLASLMELADQYHKRIGMTTRKATLPNFLCIAGAFGGMLNGITSGIIANMGVMNVDRKLNQDLRVTAHRARQQTLLPR